MRIAICDDTPNDLITIKNIVQLYAQQHKKLFKISLFNNAEELLETINNNSIFDVYFLDIVMPGINGIDCAKALRKKNISADIIYTTTSKEFAIEAFRVKAKDYLLKPVDVNILFSLLTDFLANNEKKRNTTLLCKDKLHVVSIDKLVFCEAQGNYVNWSFIDGTVLTVRETLHSTKEHLSTFSEIIQLHRSYIVNMNYINTISNGEIVLKTGHKVLIPKGKSKDIKQKYLSFQLNREVQ